MDQFPSRERAATAVAEPRVSAIVVVRGVSASGEEQARLDVALRGVLSEPWVDEVVIVDNGNAPAVSSALRALQADRRDVMLVGAPIGAGNAVAANAGVAHAHGRWLLFLSPDVVMQRGAAQRMAAAGAQAPSPWVVGGRILDTSGRELPAHLDGALSPMSVVDVALKFGARRKARRRRATPTRVGAVYALLMLMPKADFVNLGGFGDAFATDGADLDLCRRVSDAGGSVVFHPEASGVQFRRGVTRGRRIAQGLALFASRSARTPLERAFAAVAHPTLLVLLALKDFVAGRPPLPR